MNRDIKFKVWNSKHGLWASVMELLEVVPISGFIKAKTIQMGTNDEDGKEWVFNQYIGQKDKNGNEIYSGDIIKINFSSYVPNSDHVVEWDDGFCRFVGRMIERQPHSEYHQDRIYCFHPSTNCEIIGNIHENKELLK